MTPLARELPLISCIMPTTGKRRRFAEQAVKLFQAQDYPNKELIIIDESDKCGFACGPLFAYRNVQVVSIYGMTPLTIGAKRNLACSLARGDIICLWDDDDWYGSQRLSKQAEPILANTADITGLMLEVVFNAIDQTVWKCTPVLAKEIFVNGVVTGTLMFRKSLWGMKAAYPNKSIGEDADFLSHLRAEGARLACGYDSAKSFIYVRNEAINLWPLPPSPYSHMEEWQQVAIEEYLPQEDQAFYKQFMSCQQDVLT